MRKLFLLDANSLIHRAFHALPPFVNAEGKSTGALYGLSNILLKILREDKPDLIAAFFDRPEPTFRKKIFDNYKIHRPKAPDELVSQIIAARELFENFNVKTFETPGFEADDLIGTAAEKFKNQNNLEITILTGDLDTLQLVNNKNIFVRALNKGVSETVTYNADAVKGRYGIPPEHLPDYKALIGDASDNIPGVAGIGPKTASALIQKYETLENIFSRGQEEKSYPKIADKKDQALLSRKLSIIEKNAPLETSLNNLKYESVPGKKLIPYFEKLGFKSLIKRIEGEITPPQKLF